MVPKWPAHSTRIPAGTESVNCFGPALPFFFDFGADVLATRKAATANCRFLSGQSVLAAEKSLSFSFFYYFSFLKKVAAFYRTAPIFSPGQQCADE
jgi:hypothetical protein